MPNKNSSQLTVPFNTILAITG